MDQVLENITAMELEITAELHDYMEKNDLVSASNHCFNRILELGKECDVKDFNANMKRYLYAIQMLQLQIETKHLRPHEIEKVLRIAETSLTASGIKEGSRRGYLYEEIFNCKSNLLQQMGKPMGAQWELLIGKRFLSTDFFWMGSAISETMALFHMGYAREAARGFERLLEYRLDGEQRVFLELQAIKAVRLSGRLGDAGRLIKRIIHDQSLEPRTLQLLHWEEAWLTMIEKGSITPFSSMLGRGYDFPEEPYLSLIYLLYHAHPEGPARRKDLPSLITVRRRHSKKLAEADKLLFEVMELFQLLYDNDVSIRARLSQVTELIDRINILHPEYQLLFFLGLARWADRSKQKGFVTLALDKYRFLSYTMSDFQTDDVLAMSADLRSTGSALWFLNERSGRSEAALGRTMSRPIGRRVKVWTSYAKLGWQLISKNTTAQEKAACLVQTLLKNFIEHSITIKGPYAKTMQKLSQYASVILGFDDNFSRDFARIYCSIPEEDAIDIKEVFRREFGREMSEVFASWDDRPFDGGSLSQVFRATRKNGKEVAIKIKHPGLAKSAKRDWDLLKTWVCPILKRFSSYFTLASFELLENVFMDELDFVREVEMLAKFRDNFRLEPSVVIPEPYPEYCSANCITMEYIEGVSLDYFCEHASEEEKNNAGKAIFRFHLHCLFGHNLTKIDYFPANFRFADDKVIFLDFGRVVSLPDERFKAMVAGDTMAGVLQFNLDRKSFTLSLPPEVKAFEEEANTIFNTYFTPLLITDEPTPIVTDYEGFNRDMMQLFIKAAPYCESLVMANNLEYEAWFGIFHVMTRLGAKHTWYPDFINFMQMAAQNSKEMDKKTG